MIITDPKQSATTKNTVGELTKFDHSDADSTNGKI